MNCVEIYNIGEAGRCKAFVRGRDQDMEESPWR